MKQWTLCFMLALPVAAKEPPYQAAGLNSYQAAAHLLSRFSYGARPGEVEAVARQGLESWLEAQLVPRSSDAACSERLRAYPALAMDLQQLRKTYVTGPELRRLARQSGLDDSQPRSRRLALEMIRAQGLQSERELTRQLLAQKVVRAVYSEHQLQEVMTDFWFNHFNVSRSSNPARPYLLAYERDVIRPGALRDFRSLLGSTARHPAMLFYLNNAQSVANADAVRLAQPPFRWPAAGQRQAGLNENYARELLELHTLGVDGGYTQKDVTEVARVLTGWTALPRGGQAPRFERLLNQFPDSVQPGSHGFLFVPFLHDAGPKSILGTSFPAGHGLDEGERLLDMLAQHPKCSQRLARKFAVRFVGDEPDPELVRELALVFRRSGGSSAAMLRALVYSPRFWAPAALRAKVKNPMEYSFSCLRALNGQLHTRESDIPRWLEKMGQTPYGCVPPTGYPDNAEHWINSGTLVTRMNFAFELVSNRIRGVRVQLPSGGVEAVARQLLPGRDLNQALGPVRQTLANPKFFSSLQSEPAPLQLSEPQKVAGVLISCPEFQRR